MVFDPGQLEAIEFNFKVTMDLQNKERAKDDFQKGCHALRALSAKLQTIYHLCLFIDSSQKYNLPKRQMMFLCTIAHNGFKHLDEGERFSLLDCKCDDVAAKVKAELGFTAVSFDELKFVKEKRLQSCFSKRFREKKAVESIIAGLWAVYESLYEYFSGWKRSNGIKDFDRVKDNFKVPESISNKLPTLPVWFGANEWKTYITEIDFDSTGNNDTVLKRLKQNQGGQSSKHAVSKEKSKKMNTEPVPENQGGQSSKHAGSKEKSKKRKRIPESDDDNTPVKSNKGIKMSEGTDHVSDNGTTAKSSDGTEDDVERLIKELTTPHKKSTALGKIAFKTSEMGIQYPSELTGQSKSHLRALYVIDREKCEEAQALNLENINSEAIDKLVEDKLFGKDFGLFRIGKTNHWCALTSQLFVVDDQCYLVRNWAIAFHILSEQEGCDIDTVKFDIKPSWLAFPSFNSSKKLDYTIKPSLHVMCFGPDINLSSVKDFAITRETFGSIQWLNPVNIQNVELLKIVTIERLKVEVKSNELPAVKNNSLNSPARISYFEVFPPDRSKIPIFEKRLPKMLKSLGMVFETYNPTSGILVATVEHFSPYDVNFILQADLNEEDEGMDVENERIDIDPSAIDGLEHEGMEVENIDWMTRAPTADFQALEIKYPTDYAREFFGEVLQSGIYCEVPLQFIRRLGRDKFQWQDPAIQTILYIVSRMTEQLDCYVHPVVVRTVTAKMIKANHDIPNLDGVKIREIVEILTRKRSAFFVLHTPNPQHFVLVTIQRDGETWKAKIIFEQIYNTYKSKDMKLFTSYLLGKMYPNENIGFEWCGVRRRNAIVDNPTKVHVKPDGVISEDFYLATGDDGVSCGWVTMLYLIDTLSQHYQFDKSELDPVAHVNGSRLRTVGILCKCAKSLLDEANVMNTSFSRAAQSLQSTSETFEDYDAEYSYHSMMRRWMRMDVTSLENVIKGEDCPCGSNIHSSSSYFIHHDCLGTYHPQCLMQKYKMSPDTPFRCYFCKQDATKENPFILILNHNAEPEASNGPKARSIVCLFLGEPFSKCEPVCQLLQHHACKTFTFNARLEQDLENINLSHQEAPEGSEINNESSESNQESGSEDDEGSDSDSESRNKVKRKWVQEVFKFDPSQLKIGYNLHVLRRGDKVREATIRIKNKDFMKLVSLKYGDEALFEMTLETAKIEDLCSKYQLGCNGKYFLPHAGLEVNAFHPEKCREATGRIGEIYDADKGYATVQWDNENYEDSVIHFVMMRPLRLNGMVQGCNDDIEGDCYKRGYLGVQFLVWEGMEVFLHHPDRTLTAEVCEIQPYVAELSFRKFGGPKDTEWHPYALMQPLNSDALISGQEYPKIARKKSRHYEAASHSISTQKDSSTQEDSLKKFLSAQRKRNSISFNLDRMNSDNTEVLEDDFNQFSQNQLKWLVRQRGYWQILIVPPNEGDIERKEIDLGGQIDKVPFSDLLKELRKAVAVNTESTMVTYGLLSSLITSSWNMDIRLSTFSMMPIYFVFIRNAKSYYMMKELHEYVCDKNDNADSMLLLIHGPPELSDIVMSDSLESVQHFCNRFDRIWTAYFDSQSTSSQPIIIDETAERYQRCGDVKGFMKMMMNALRAVSDNDFTKVVNEYHFNDAKSTISDFLRNRRHKQYSPDKNMLSKRMLEIAFGTKTLIGKIHKDGIEMEALIMSSLLDNLHQMTASGGNIKKVFKGTLESVTVNNIAICKHPKRMGFMLYCKCCEQYIRPDPCEDLHEAIKDVMIIAPLHVFSNKNVGQRKERCTWAQAPINANTVYRLSYQDTEVTVASLETCQPVKKIGSCLGSDQFILSAIETEMSGDDDSSVVWRNFIDLLDSDHVTKHIENLSSILVGEKGVSVLNRTLSRPILRMASIEEGPMVYKGDDDLSVEAVLTDYLEEVAAINIHHGSYPTRVEDSWEIPEEVRSGINNILSLTGQDLNSVTPILWVKDSAPPDCHAAEAYRELPELVLPYIYDPDCKKKDEQIHVFKSRVPNTDSRFKTIMSEIERDLHTATRFQMYATNTRQMDFSTH